MGFFKGLEISFDRVRKDENFISKHNIYNKKVFTKLSKSLRDVDVFLFLYLKRFFD